MKKKTKKQEKEELAQHRVIDEKLADFYACLCHVSLYLKDVELVSALRLEIKLEYKHYMALDDTATLILEKLDQFVVRHKNETRK